jgi:PAS domain S-box-containing protein
MTFILLKYDISQFKKEHIHVIGLINKRAVIILPVIKDAIFESSAEAMIISNSDGKILDANQRCLSLFGYLKNDLVGQQIEILLPDQFKKHHSSYREKFNKHPKNRPMGDGGVLYGKKQTGEEIPVSISLGHTSLKGKNYVLAFIIDITEQVEAKNKLKKLNSELERRVESRTKELAELVNKLGKANGELVLAEEEVREALSKERELNELKSRFVSMASHEFRTPLSTIMSSASLIGKYQLTEQNDKRSKHVDRIHNNVRNLTALLNDFLSLERLSEGKVNHVVEQFDLKSFASEIIDEIASQKSPLQTLKFNYQGASTYASDERVLKNILLNLLSNALKYTNDKGNVELIITNSKSQLKIDVVDDGIGIPKEEQQHLFERFFRAKNVTNIQGTGLGLSIVGKYLELLGGEIEIQSEYMEGTTVSIVIPTK